MFLFYNMMIHKRLLRAAWEKVAEREYSWECHDNMGEIVWLQGVYMKERARVPKPLTVELSISKRCLLRLKAIEKAGPCSGIEFSSAAQTPVQQKPPHRMRARQGSRGPRLTGTRLTHARLGAERDDACMQERVTPDGGRLGHGCEPRRVGRSSRLRGSALIVAVMRHTSLPTPVCRGQALIMIPYADGDE
ncbi:hypothetical protein VTN00DRAFT_7069 [Thermoascus crustaceus]|uniref:uncharacterized protein n=1 Tax=Thermoascus crustaceus TaxID=5088 RepID=UPI0037434BF6